MDARLNLFDNPVAGKFLKYLTSANNVVSDSTLPAFLIASARNCMPM